MKALQIVAPKRCEIVDLPMPEPGPDQVLVKVLAVTTCPHWDMHVFDGIPMLGNEQHEYPHPPGQPGHEACGDIVAIGDGVQGIPVGERVCVWCDQGHARQGCYAQYVIAEARNVIPVPRSIPPEYCAPLELGMCIASHMLFARKLNVIADKTVGVFGLGPAGLVAVQLAKDAGAAKVVGFDPMQSRREMAAKLGADVVLDPGSPEGLSFPRRFEQGCLHTTFDCVGIPRAVHRAMELTTEMVILFAVQREPYVFGPEYWGGFALVGARFHTREAAEYTAARLASGQLDLKPLVTKTMRLEQFPEAVELLKSKEVTKVAFLPQESA